ncbi:hypothetical protein GGX14DRAFT_563889 [Mycena pura]|uniref:Uncharacterized protein n=1 Tax=Mycena pura TaxID=153505 RepID=A0AAD6YF78_9AGAR|nr:hypothetical protein GGX14DRAFT_563889 [Mycena pura]
MVAARSHRVHAAQKLRALVRGAGTGNGASSFVLRTISFFGITHCIFVSTRLLLFATQAQSEFHPLLPDSLVQARQTYAVHAVAPAPPPAWRYHQYPGGFVWRGHGPPNCWMRTLKEGMDGWCGACASPMRRCGRSCAGGGGEDGMEECPARDSRLRRASTWVFLPSLVLAASVSQTGTIALSLSQTRRPPSASLGLARHPPSSSPVHVLLGLGRRPPLAARRPPSSSSLAHPSSVPASLAGGPHSPSIRSPSTLTDLGFCLEFSTRPPPLDLASCVILAHVPLQNPFAVSLGFSRLLCIPARVARVSISAAEVRPLVRWGRCEDGMEKCPARQLARAPVFFPLELASLAGGPHSPSIRSPSTLSDLGFDSRLARIQHPPSSHWTWLPPSLFSGFLASSASPSLSHRRVSSSALDVLPRPPPTSAITTRIRALAMPPFHDRPAALYSPSPFTPFPAHGSHAHQHRAATVLFPSLRVQQGGDESGYIFTSHHDSRCVRAPQHSSP